MAARGSVTTPRAFLIFVVVLALAGWASAWAQQSRYPIKVRLPRAGESEFGVHGTSMISGRTAYGWNLAAGASRRTILCPKRGFAFALGMRPFFSTLSGSVKATSRGGEGTLLNLHGHLRVPDERTLWEFYSNMRIWDKVTVKLEYKPWNWSGPGHAGTNGNFAGLLLEKDDGITTNLNITTFMIGADYDVSFGRDLTFGPNGDFHIIKWSQRVDTEVGDSMDFVQTILQPAIGGHFRYEPTNTGYFSWFKPYMEARFSWMNFDGLGLSTWNMGAGVSPPVSRNVDAGVKLGYKQWKLDGNRKRLFLDVGVEGLYLDFALKF
jgi:hypothetical protein